jgi:UPF0716 protein FxsA
LRAFHIFLILFLVVPVIEIYVLIQVGAIIGAIPTILLILVTAVIGAVLLRQQGLSTLARFQTGLASGTLPAKEMIEGILLAVGGALLMTPGFVTDAIGFFCLISITRTALAHYIMKRSAGKVKASMSDFANAANTNSKSHNKDNKTYEGEFVRKKDGRLDRR